MLTTRNQKRLKANNIEIAERSEQARKVEVHDKAYFVAMLTAPLELESKADNDVQHLDVVV